MAFSSRYADDPTEPTVTDALRDVAVRAVLPSVALAAANVALGRALARRTGLRERETAVIERLQARRTPTRDAIAKVTSAAADVPASIAHGLVATAVLQWRTRHWWVAALPAVALILETWTYLAAGAVVNRERPDVARLDRDQPTSSFPSGHQGATVALMVLYALLARGQGSRRSRTATYAACLAYPATLAWSRVYVGLHYPSDVAVGTANGLVSGLLAWNYLRRDDTPRAPAGHPAG